MFSVRKFDMEVTQGWGVWGSREAPCHKIKALSQARANVTFEKEPSLRYNVLVLVTDKKE